MDRPVNSSKALQRRIGLQLLLMSTCAFALHPVGDAGAQDPGEHSVPKIDQQKGEWDLEQEEWNRKFEEKRGKQKWFKYLPVEEDLSSLSDDEISRRIDFLSDRLDDGRHHAWLWNKGWGSFYGIGVLYGTYKAATEKDRGHRADAIVSLTKASIGLTRIYFGKLSAENGADPVRAIPSHTRPLLESKLLEAKKQMAVNARRAHERYSLKAHAISWGLNILGGVIIWQVYGEDNLGAISTGMGIAVGELIFFSQPGRALKDVKAYDRRFGSPLPSDLAGPPISFNVGPTKNGTSGAAFRIEF
jgi:hypothetical protein